MPTRSALLRVKAWHPVKTGYATVVMNDTDEFHFRCRQLEREYESVGRDLMRIKVRKASEHVGPTGGIVYACLFNAACVTIQDTLFMLQAEADEYHAKASMPPITVIGVHEDWMDFASASARRCLWIDDEGVCNDIVFDEPIKIGCVHFIHFLPEGEIETHHRLTEAISKAGIIRINPAGAVADICNSKHKTSGALQSSGVRTPETLFFSRFSLCDSSGVSDRLRGFMGEKESLLFLQPDVGTEARDTAALRVQAGAESEKSLIGEIISRGEDTVVRQARGNLFYSGPESDDAPRRFVIRVNAFAGMVADELSGYAMVADTPERDIVAISQGARKLPLGAVLDCLSDEHGQRHNAADARKSLYLSAKETFDAINADAAEADRVLLMGIDFVLEIAAGELQAVVIDVNPRAVIAHSTFAGGNREKPGLGEVYWQGLSSRVLST